MDFNFHTHTPYCGHAVGEMEEYVQCAIEGGIRYMGFSEHGPFVFPDGYESAHRVPVAKAAAYAANVVDLQEKYKGIIELHTGYEIEYYPEHFSKMVDTARQFGAEYLILGQHFLYGEHPHGVHAMTATTRAEDLQEYVTSITSAIESGLITYVAHPDMLNFTGDPALYRNGVLEICRASASCMVPLEINCLGIRSHRNYPNDTFWSIVGETDALVTTGFDAHDPSSAYDEASLVRVQEYVDAYGLRFVGRPALRDIRIL